MMPAASSPRSSNRSRRPHSITWYSIEPSAHESGVTAAGAAVVVRDGTFNGQAYQGASATLEDPTTARVQLVPTGPYGGGSTELLATAASGIAAADDGGTWPGTVATGGVTLPYP